jgi:predicted DNA-binding mobile mystery protein A
MKKRKLIQTQIDNKLVQFNNLEKVVVPPNGWIYSIRQGINMSLRQLGKRLSITPQSVKEIEEREKTGAISLKVLKQVASALDMHFVYGFTPKDKTLAMMVERRALELAKQIVERTSIQMNLEDQKIDDIRLEQAVKEKAEELSKEIPSMLWD